jgi:putative glutamine amidotransferase
MKPLIGVTPDFNAGDRKDMGGREPTYFLRDRYVRAIETLGGLPVILPLTDDPALQRRLFEGLDGVMLTGSGPDLPPRLYGESQRYKFRVMSRKRYAFELAMIRQAVRTAKPLFGICGGMQALNVALGGSLVQDIGAQLPEALQHRAPGPATNYAHRVTVAPDSLLRRITKQQRLSVNSSHHQSVKAVAPTLTASAVASDGEIEAVEAADRRRHPFLLGVQWHPEYLFERYPIQRRLFQAFLQAARRG